MIVLVHLWHNAAHPAHHQKCRLWEEFSFPTNLHSFVSFGKTHKLHNAIDHWLAGVTGQAHVALDAVTKEERAVTLITVATGRRRNKEGKGGSSVLGHLGKTGERWGPLTGGQTLFDCGWSHWRSCCAQSEWRSEETLGWWWEAGFSSLL